MIYEIFFKLMKENFISNSFYGNISEQDQYNTNKNIQYQKYKVKKQLYFNDKLKTKETFMSKER